MEMNKEETKDYTYGFKVGDLITTYHKGIHEVISIKRRFYERETDIPSFLKGVKSIGDEYDALIYYKKILNANGVKAKSISQCCDIGFCKPFSSFIKEKEEELNRFKSILKNE